MSGFYVMQCLEGDECLVARADTLEAALERMAAERAHIGYADLSVWSVSPPRIVAMYDHDGNLNELRYDPRGKITLEAIL